MLLEYKIPIFLLLFIINILGSSFCIFSITILELSVEKSFINIISKFSKFWFSIEFIDNFIELSHLNKGIITLIFIFLLETFILINKLLYIIKSWFIYKDKE